jgi:hypothetical protein
MVAVLLAVKVRVLAPLTVPVTAVELGLNDAVTRFGSPVADRVTLPLKLNRDATVMPVLPLAPP